MPFLDLNVQSQINLVLSSSSAWDESLTSGPFSRLLWAMENSWPPPQGAGLFHYCCAECHQQVLHRYFMYFNSLILQTNEQTNKQKHKHLAYCRFHTKFPSSPRVYSQIEMLHRGSKDYYSLLTFSGLRTNVLWFQLKRNVRKEKSH